MSGGGSRARRVVNQSLSFTPLTRQKEEEEEDDGMLSRREMITEADRVNSNTYNPYEGEHFLSLSFRMLLIGAARSGKTTTVLNYLHKLQKGNQEPTFSKIYVVVPSSTEEIYLAIRRDFNVEFLEMTKPLPNFEEFDFESNTLFIMDDLVTTATPALKKQILDYFARSGKFGVSIFYITQDYFSTDTFLRRNCTHFALLGLFPNDISIIAKRCGSGVTSNALQNMYKHCAKTRYRPLIISVSDRANVWFRIAFSERTLNPADYENGRIITQDRKIFHLANGYSLELKVFASDEEEKMVTNIEDVFAYLESVNRQPPYQL
jgi:hypothetical protein